MGSPRLLASCMIELSVEPQDREALEDCGKCKVVSFFTLKICGLEVSEEQAPSVPH